MKVSLKWLSEYVEVPNDTQAFCDKLDLTGTGVEGIDESGAAFSGVVVGQVASKVAHPDSDHLWCTLIDVGEQNVDAEGNPTPLEIVCGAQNFQEGDKVPVAMVGAELPGGFKIKKSKMRGKVSMGMNCSSQELGLGEGENGLLILPADAPVGVDFAQYLGLADRILDLEITPNRPDCLSMEGMAREVGAMYRVPVASVTEGYPLIETDESAEDLVSVEIADPGRCPRYTARVIRNVKVGPSPDWLAERVTAAGSRSINNVVDITNYVLFLLGQPLHAFDYDALEKEDNGKVHIIVRAAEEGELFTTLDGEERELTSDMTVIATPKRAVALAGVMGGLDTEVTEDTTTVLLEAATFSQAHTSRTSRNLSLISESSLRYERKVDAERIQRNTDFAAALIAALAGGKVCRDTVDAWPVKEESVQLRFRHRRFCAMMGADIPKDFIIDILQRLGCQVAEASDDALDVVAPSFRPDLEREIDLYEEVLRLYGMERIPSTLPGGRGRIGKLTEAQQIEAKLHATLRACGLNETMTYAFASPEDLNMLRMDGCVSGEAVELINPINADQSVMRQSLIPGLLRSVSYNQNHGVENIQLYETGNVFTAHEGKKQPREHQKIAGMLAGSMQQAGWNARPQAFNFFDGKGVLESVARELALPKVQFRKIESDEAPYLQPGRAATMMANGAVMGWVGEIHPLAVKAYEANAPVVAFELDMNALLKAARPARDYVEIPEFPPVNVDVAFVVDEGMTHERLMQSMKSAGGKLLASARLFDVYRSDERLGAGKKSMAYALEYRAADRTLTGEEVEKAHNRLITKVCNATGAEVRG